MLGSKDSLDWNIRVRGWAFSKRSNRRKRLVMSKCTERKPENSRFGPPGFYLTKSK